MEFIFDNSVLFLDKYNNLSDYNIVIVDSVINTGKSIDTILNKLRKFKFKKIFVITLCNTS